MPTNITKKRIVPSSEEKRGENRAWKEPEPEPEPQYRQLDDGNYELEKQNEMMILVAIGTVNVSGENLTWTMTGSVGTGSASFTWIPENSRYESGINTLYFLSSSSVSGNQGTFTYGDISGLYMTTDFAITSPATGSIDENNITAGPRLTTTKDPNVVWTLKKYSKLGVGPNGNVVDVDPINKKNITIYGSTLFATSAPLLGEKVTLKSTNTSHSVHDVQFLVTNVSNTPENYYVKLTSTDTEHQAISMNDDEITIDHHLHDAELFTLFNFQGMTGTGGMYGTIPDSGGSTDTGGMYGTIPDSGGSTGTGGMTPYWELRFKEGQAFDTSDKEYKVIIQVQELPTQDNQNPVAVEQTMIITIDKIPVDDTLEIISLVDGFSLNFPNNQDKILFPFKPKGDHHIYYSFLIADDDNNFEFNTEGPDIYLKKKKSDIK